MTDRVRDRGAVHRAPEGGGRSFGGSCVTGDNVQGLRPPKQVISLIPNKLLYNFALPMRTTRTNKVPPNQQAARRPSSFGSPRFRTSGEQFVVDPIRSIVRSTASFSSERHDAVP